MKQEFKQVTFSDIFVTGVIPQDLILKSPDDSQIPTEDRHFLLCIPWEEKYQRLVPSDFQAFFNHVLPHLHIRTTDVHTAICLGLLDDALINNQQHQPNRRVLGLSLILHDCGWSLLNEAEIVQSLGVKGLALTQNAIIPKEKHAIEGERLSRDLLTTFDFNPPLSQQEINKILLAVRFHDQPERVANQGDAMPIEVKLLVDLDHLWSFTKENFWQDTLRKGVDPQEYVDNLQQDVSSYFVTDWGKSKAQALLTQRRLEVVSLET